MPARIPTIGILAVSAAESLDVLKEALEGEGWVAGRNYEAIMPTPSSVDAALAGNMRSLLDAGVDLVIAQTKPAARVAMRATRTLPVVLGAFNGDPAAEGIVASLERPGGNVTGTYYHGHAGAAQRFDLLGQLVPGLKRVGILMNPRSAFSRELADQACDIARAAGLASAAIGITDPASVEKALSDAVAAGVQGAVAVSGADMYALRGAIAAASWQKRMPVVMGSIGYAELGGLAKLGPDIPVLWRRMAAAHVIPVMKGANPGELPMIGLDVFELVINLTSATRLGLTVSDTLKARAAKVVYDVPAAARVAPRSPAA